LLAFLLALSILPATGEVVELVVHWATHGDVAHVAGDAHDTTPMGSDEHGCSGLFHMCACHTAQATTTQVSVIAASAPPNRAVDSVAPLADAGRDAPSPTIRPPIA